MTDWLKQITDNLGSIQTLIWQVGGFVVLAGLLVYQQVNFSQSMVQLMHERQAQAERTEQVLLKILEEISKRP